MEVERVESSGPGPLWKDEATMTFNPQRPYWSIRACLLNRYRDAVRDDLRREVQAYKMEHGKEPDATELGNINSRLRNKHKPKFDEQIAALERQRDPSPPRFHFNRERMLNRRRRRLAEMGIIMEEVVPPMYFAHHLNSTERITAWRRDAVLQRMAQRLHDRIERITARREALEGIMSDNTIQKFSQIQLK